MLTTKDIDTIHEYAAEVVTFHAAAQQWLEATVNGQNRGWSVDPTIEAARLLQELKEGKGLMPLYFGDYDFMSSGEMIHISRDGVRIF